MKVSVICVVVSMVVTLDMSYATCTISLIADCQSAMKSSLSTMTIPSQACGIMDTYLDCVQSCSNSDADEAKRRARGLLSDLGIDCGESLTSSQDSSVTESIYSCPSSLVTRCQSFMKASLATITSKSEICRIADTFLHCVRTCADPVLTKKLTYKVLSERGIECGESQTSSPPPGPVVSSNPQVIEHNAMSYSCKSSLMASCRSSVDRSLSSIKTHVQACRVMDTYLDCVRSCGSHDLMKQLGYGILSDHGIECGSTNSSTDIESSTGSGSTMVTLSGTMLMLMLFTTLRNFF